MKQPVNYIATWFYKESAEEASFYPQMGQKGDSALVHSIYMQIQVPFFRTFQHYNPSARLLFFSNLKKQELPAFLQRLFDTLNVETVTLSYTCKPPKNWYSAWQNQFYLYDILRYMEGRMQPDDALLVTDADCLCRTSLKSLFDKTREKGSALYEFITDRKANINGVTLPEMDEFYEACYHKKPQQPITYYGGEFICLRGDLIARINKTYPELWHFNLQRTDSRQSRLNEEAHVLSIMAEHLQFRNRIANDYVKRMWTSPQFNNIMPEDMNIPVWHLPYEKKRGLYRLFRYIEKRQGLGEEKSFWENARKMTGIPTVSLQKKIYDRITTILIKLKR